MAAPKGRKAPIVGLLGLLVGLVAGYGAGRVSTGTPLNPLTGQGGSYQQGYDAAKKKIDDAHIFPPTPTSLTVLSGTVKSVGAGSLVLSADISSPNPLDTLSVPAERTVTVSKDTKLMKQVPKSSAELQADFEAAQKAASNGAPPPAPPSVYKLVPITLADLKAGDAVSVMADHDILSEQAFTAVEIDLVSAMPTPSPSASANPSASTNANGAPDGTPGPSGQPAPNGTPGPTGAPPTTTP